MTISSYTAKDQITLDVLQQIATIFVENFTAAPRFENWSIQSALDYLQSLRANGAHTWVSMGQGDMSKVLGFAIGVDMNQQTMNNEPSLLTLLDGEVNQTKAFYLEEIAVSKVAHGKGLGKQLMKATIQDSRLSYHTYITRVRSDAPAMISLLESLNFQRIGSYTASKGGVSAQRFIYQLHLS